MPLTPVDYDPFAQDAPQQAALKLTPVDYDPFAQASDNPGFLDRVGSDFQKRQDMVKPAISDMMSGQQGPTETLFQVFGKGPAGFANDVIGEGLKSAVSSLPEPVKQAGSNVLSAVGNTAAGRMVGSAADSASQAYDNFAQDNPRAARDVEAALNIGGLAGGFIPVKGTSAVGAITDVAKQGLDTAIPAVDNALGKTIRPKAADLKKVAQENYKRAEDLGGTLSGDFTNNIIDHAQSFATKDKMAAAVSGENPLSSMAQELEQFRDEPMTLDRATSFDQALTEKLDDPKFTDKNGVLNTYGRQLLEIKNNLRQNLIGAAENGHVQGGAEGINAYRTAVKDWAAQSQISDIQRIVDRASYMDNPATALKTGFRNIAVNPGRLSKFSPEVQKAIKHAARDGDLANILRTEIGSRLISSVAGGMVGSAAGPVGTIAGTAAGFAGSRMARNTAEKMQMGRVNKVVDAIAAKSSMPTTRVSLSDQIKMNRGK